MLIEIEETVRFLASFLIGKIPRRRLDDFVETLANLLVERFLKTQNRMRVCKFIVNVNGMSDQEIREAAREAQINEERIRSMWPKSLILELQPGMIMAVNAETGANKIVYPIRQQLFNHAIVEQGKNRRVQQTNCNSSSSGNLHVKAPISCSNARERLLRRTQMRIVWASSYDGFACEPENRPFFEIAQEKISCTAQYFASTRFGSTKPKSHQGYDMGCGFHPFTSPSVYSYVQLLFLLNSLASWMPDSKGDSNFAAIERILNSGNFHPPLEDNANEVDGTLGKDCNRELLKEALTSTLSAGPDTVSLLSFTETKTLKINESGDSKQEFA